LGKLGAGAEWAFSPFTVSGEMTWGATHGAAIPWVPLGGFAGHPEYIDPVSQLPVWTKQALEEKGVGGYLGSFLPGGEVHERYRELPIWQQLLYETPALIATGGITAGGIRGALKPAAEAATIAGRTAKVARAALKPAELVETGIAKATSKITNPILKRLGLQMEAQKTARRATTKVRKVELRERVANAESIYKKVMQETGDPELARRASMNALRGEMPTVKAGAIGEALTPEEVTQLRLKISEHANYFERIRADSSLNKLFFTEDVLQPAELKLLERIFPGVSELNTLKLKMGSGLWSQFVDIANLPRALLASTDLSITLRQGGILLARFPGGFKDVMKVQLRTLFSSDNWKYYDDLIRTDPDFYLFENVGGKVHGYLAPEPGAAVKIGAREEYFPSALAEKIIPTVKPSERAFTAGGNYLRYFGGFKKWWSLAQKAGYTDQNTIEGIIKLVNWSTGRGSLPRWAGTGAPFVNAMLFAPRFVFSRLQLPTLLFHSSPFVRKEAARTLVQFLGAGITVLSLASAAGAKVELDPRSSDFGKIRVGNTRLDIWAGYVQWARFLAQAVTGQSKVTGTGEIVERNRLDTIMNLIQSKESPFASIFTDLMKGETFTGEPVISWESLRSRFTPLFIQDLLDAIETDGWQGAAVSGAPALLGVGAVSYEAKRQKPSGLPGLPSSGLPTLPK
jgi:hypothetical protein